MPENRGTPRGVSRHVTAGVLALAAVACDAADDPRPAATASTASTTKRSKRQPYRVAEDGTLVLEESLWCGHTDFWTPLSLSPGSIAFTTRPARYQSRATVALLGSFFLPSRFTHRYGVVVSEALWLIAIEQQSGRSHVAKPACLPKGLTWNCPVDLTPPAPEPLKEGEYPSYPGNNLNIDLRHFLGLPGGEGAYRVLLWAESHLSDVHTVHLPAASKIGAADDASTTSAATLGRAHVPGAAEPVAGMPRGGAARLQAGAGAFVHGVFSGAGTPRVVLGYALPSWRVGYTTVPRDGAFMLDANRLVRPRPEDKYLWVVSIQGDETSEPVELDLLPGEIPERSKSHCTRPPAAARPDPNDPLTSDL